jgi:hypothetical protein
MMDLDEDADSDTYCKVKITLKKSGAEKQHAVCTTYSYINYDSPFNCKHLNFLAWDTVMYATHLNLALTRCGHHHQVHVSTDEDLVYLGLQHSQYFGKTLSPLKLMKESTLWLQKYPILWLKERKGRYWNQSWFYDSDADINTEAPQHNPQELNSNGEIGLLLIEAMHMEREMWTRVDGKWLLSAEMMVNTNYFDYIAFLINMETSDVQVVYKTYQGQWRQAPTITLPAVKILIGECNTLAPPTMRDACLVPLFSTSTPITKLPFPHMEKKRLRHLHTRMMRFPVLADKLTFQT